MTFVLYAIAFFLGALNGFWLASLCTASAHSDLEDEVYRLQARLYQLGDRA